MKRRRFLAVSLLIVPLRGQTQANAHVSTTDPLIVAITKGKDVMPGKVTLELPALAVNGHSVAMTVRVDSPMSAAEHVRAVHLISEKNPVREMATFYLGPHSGRAEVGSRIRLNGTQRMTAVAELSDGTFWSDQVAVEVREAACTDGG
ncbi:MAG TPA: thiosulfate oxidation carrier protein SoxY [Burkholderiales bacterium]|jgi:sulfur-oxidizing protein SoxY